jgi:group I intron endonuclease
MAGIYKITNPAGSVYIGQAVNFSKRWAQHRCLKNPKGQSAIYRSFKKYGVSAHSFEVIVEGIDLDELTAYEALYINFYKHKGCNMLNISPAGARAGSGKWSDERKEHQRKLMLGRTFTEEAKRKMSVAAYHRTNEHKANLRIAFLNNGVSEKQKAHYQKEGKRLSKAVVQFAKDGAFIAEYESGSVAAKQLNIVRSGLTKCARGEAKTAGGFIFKYKKAL